MTRLIPILIATLLSSFAFAADLDEDGLDDDFEQQIINARLPWLYYDGNERWWPCGIEWFVRRSELLYEAPSPPGIPQSWPGEAYPILTLSQLSQNPMLLVSFTPPPDRVAPWGATVQFPSSSYQTTRGGTKYFCNIFNEHRHGEGPFPVGMYAHMTPLTGPIDYHGWDPLTGVQPGDLLLQYWQLFPNNDSQAPFDVGDHEGDWIWIDLILSPDAATIKYAAWHHHGDGHCDPAIFPLESRPITFLDGAPVCYIEEGSHEWWPWPSTEDDDHDCFGSDPHDGQGVRLRAANVRNVGEIFAPMPDLESQIFIKFNGKWGWQGGGSDAPPTQSIQSSNYWGLQSAFFASPLLVAHVSTQGSDAPQVGSGSQSYPKGTVQAAVVEVVANMQLLNLPGRLRIHPGSYAAPAGQIGLGVSNPLTIEAASGPVTIGQ